VSGTRAVRHEGRFLTFAAVARKLAYRPASYRSLRVRWNIVGLGATDGQSVVIRIPLTHIRRAKRES